MKIRFSPKLSGLQINVLMRPVDLQSVITFKGKKSKLPPYIKFTLKVEVISDYNSSNTPV